MTDAERLHKIRLELQFLDVKRGTLWGLDVDDYVFFVEAVESWLTVDRVTEE
jgi:hypothetical protein